PGLLLTEPRQLAHAGEQLSAVAGARPDARRVAPVSLHDEARQLADPIRHRHGEAVQSGALREGSRQVARIHGGEVRRVEGNAEPAGELERSGEGPLE